LLPIPIEVEVFFVVYLLFVSVGPAHHWKPSSSIIDHLKPALTRRLGLELPVGQRTYSFETSPLSVRHVTRLGAVVSVLFDHARSMHESCPVLLDRPRSSTWRDARIQNNQGSP
jgi:hypothetical protein